MAIPLICIILPIPAQTFERIPAYRAFTSPGISASLASDILAHLNIAVRGYYREFARDTTSMNILKNEQEWMEFLRKEGLLNTGAIAHPRKWEEVDYVVFLDKREKKDICQISMFSITGGEYFRAPVSSTKPHEIAKSLASLMADQITDTKQKRILKMFINSYFSNFRNSRTMDFFYYGVLCGSEGLQTLPVNVGIGLTFPLIGPFGFVTRYSGIYQDQDHIDLSAGAGLTIQKNGRFSPEFAFLGGYTGNIQSETYNGGPFLKPAIGLGFYLSENFKISADGSFQLAYFPSTNEFSTMAFAGVKVSLGF